MTKRELMNFWTGLQIYIVASAALAGTSYINLYRPAIRLLEEIMGEEVTRYSGWLGITIWLMMAFILSPLTLLLLLSNDNDEFIEKFAVSIASNLIEEDE